MASGAGAGVSTPGLGRHIPALDGLRGCAVLAVILYHYLQLNPLEAVHLVDRLAYTVAYAGWSGVDLFFVLSGFLITGILYDTRHHPDYFRTFYIRRVLRIFPLYYGFLAVVFFVLPLGSPLGSAATIDPVTEVSLWTYLVNLRISFSGWNVVPLYLAPFWSLAIEEQFYLVWPLLVLLLSRRALLATCAALATGGLLLRASLHALGMPDAAEALTPARMDGLAVGAALALACRDEAAYHRIRRWAKPVLLAAVALLAGMLLWRDGFATSDPVVGTVGLSVLALACAATLLLAVTAPEESVVARVFACAPLRFFGRYSYGLYVVHQAVGLLLVSQGITAAALSPFPGSALPGQLAFLAIGTSGSVAVALLSWHLYEKHFLRLKDRFRYGSDRAAAGEEARPAVALSWTARPWRTPRPR